VFEIRDYFVLFWFTTTLKFQGYSDTCPPLHCMYAASCCAIERCYWTRPVSFLIPRTALFMVPTKLRRSCSSQPWYTLKYGQPHTQKSHGFTSGDRAGQATGSFVPIHFALYFSVTILLPLSRHVEVPIMMQPQSSLCIKRHISI